MVLVEGRDFVRACCGSIRGASSAGAEPLLVFEEKMEPPSRLPEDRVLSSSELLAFVANKLEVAYRQS